MTTTATPMLPTHPLGGAAPRGLLKFGPMYHSQSGANEVCMALLTIQPLFSPQGCAYSEHDPIVGPSRVGPSRAAASWEPSSFPVAAQDLPAKAVSHNAEEGSLPN